tara:strand:+ start:34743 stop:34973 length:231 start_codon:yes stop_codon:yes gene_type:complete
MQFNPNGGRFDVEQAHLLLGMEEEDKEALRILVAVDLLCAHVGITDDQLKTAYENKLKAHLLEASDNLRSLVDKNE